MDPFIYDTYWFALTTPTFINHDGSVIRVDTLNVILTIIWWKTFIADDIRISSYALQTGCALFSIWTLLVRRFYITNIIISSVLFALTKFMFIRKQFIAKTSHICICIFRIHRFTRHCHGHGHRISFWMFVCFSIRVL